MVKQLKRLILCGLFIFNSLQFYGQKKPLDSAYIYYKNGENYIFKNKPFKAYLNYTKALKVYSTKQQIDSIALCNLKLYELINSQKNLNLNSKPYLDNYYKIALAKKDSLMLLIANNRYAEFYWDPKDLKPSKNYYFKSLKYIKAKKINKYKSALYSNLALLYTIYKPDSASFYFKESLKYANKKNKIDLFSIYLNYANFYEKQSQFTKALTLLNKAQKNIPEIFTLKYNKIIYGKFASCYQAIGNYKKAYKYYTKYNNAKDSLNNTQQNIAIADLDKKYKTAEKEKEILISKQKNKQQQNIIIAGLAVVLFSSIIVFLVLKNSSKKRKIATKEKELEQQKNLALIKEQELTTINAMIDGQEKERKRIAEDLHDNLGSVLATLKLHFENLQLNKNKQKINQDALFNKTETLIDDAYKKVREIAHAKNAGVIANQGLLVAVQVMAEKISAANTIKIEVIHFGLNKPIENNLEITVFRIIQELTTNIIKHANATLATINISFFDNNLNIIVEDNGKGLNEKLIKPNKGMGISSIKTRVKHLKGTFTIDSIKNKGTTILIDIPTTNNLN